MNTLYARDLPLFPVLLTLGDPSLMPTLLFDGVIAGLVSGLDSVSMTNRNPSRVLIPKSSRQLDILPLKSREWGPDGRSYRTEIKKN